MHKLSKLKQELIQHNLDLLLVPMRDEFGCEYVPPQGRRIEYLTEFTGSNAFLIIRKEGKSIFFTDGRYTLQATQEIDQNEYEIIEQATLSQFKWLEKNLSANTRIGFDPKIFSISDMDLFNDICSKKDSSLIAIEENLIDNIWNDKPSPSYSQTFALPESFTGQNTKAKFEYLNQNISEDFFLETDPENICWLLNIRGKDLEYTPIFLGYLLFSKNGNHIIFSDNESLNDIDLENNIKIKKLSEIKESLSELSNKKISLDEDSCPQIFKNILGESNAQIIDINSPLTRAKAIKNDTEVKNIKQAHIIDGVAICKFFNWIEKELNNNNLYTEFEVSEQLSEFRKQHESCLSLSFDTIAGFNENGAIIHYRPLEDKSLTITNNGMLLLDSGAQYYGNNIGGTTDITRTVYFGEPTQEQKTDYTLVLKGHIAIAQARFEEGIISGYDLDRLARRFLREKDKDYKHGTGHGVGYLLNVHEGPYGISKTDSKPLTAGLILSNEPGFYKEGEYGIRIENLIYVKKSQIDGHLEIKTLSKVPIALNLIDTELLTKNEKKWLNNYHKEVFEQLSEFLEGDDLLWLKENTKEI